MSHSQEVAGKVQPFLNKTNKLRKQSPWQTLILLASFLVGSYLKHQSTFSSTPAVLSLQFHDLLKILHHPHFEALPYLLYAINLTPAKASTLS